MAFIKNDDLVKVQLLRSMYVRGEFYAAGDIVAVGRRDAREMIYQERAAPVGQPRDGEATPGEADPVQAQGQPAKEQPAAKGGKRQGSKRSPQPDGGAAGSGSGNAAPAVESVPRPAAPAADSTSDTDF